VHLCAIRGGFFGGHRPSAYAELIRATLHSAWRSCGIRPLYESPTIRPELADKRYAVSGDLSTRDHATQMHKPYGVTRGAPFTSNVFLSELREDRVRADLRFLHVPIAFQ
jgi:hypothetical protein